MAITQQIKILKGTTLKMQIFWDYPSDPAISLDTVDFYVEYYTNLKQKVTLRKSDLVREEVVPETGDPFVNWYAYVQTTDLPTGNLMMRLHASIPDGDAPDGIKVEYTECSTNVVLYG